MRNSVILTLRHRLIVYTSGIILLVGGGTALYTTYEGRRQAYREFEDRILTLSRLFAETLIEDLYFLNVKGLRLALEQMRYQQHVASAYITDADGLVLSDGTVANPLRNQQLSNTLGGDARGAGEWVSRLEGGFLNVRGPIRMADQRVIGYFEAAFSLAPVDEALTRARRAGLWLTLVCLTVGGMLAFIVANGVSRPICDLVTATTEIGSGKLATRVTVARRDELGTLAESINKMATDLQERTVSRDYVDSIIRSMSNALITLGADGRIQMANRAALDLLEYDSEEQLSGQLGSVLLEEEARTAKSRFDVMLRGGLVRDHEVMWRARDGRQVPVSLSGAMLYAADGVRTGTVLVAQDVTAQRETELQLRKAREAAEAAAALKAQFLANASHEIRTPIGVVLGMTDLLLDTDLTTEQRDLLDRLHRSGDTLMTVIDDLLDFSKIEAGKIDLQSVDFDVREMLDDVAELLAERARGKNVELAVWVAEEVARGVRGDPTRLRQILINLVGNALKFTDSGEVVVGVRLTEATGESAVLRFDVSDTGIGIPPERQPLLFQPFSQVATATKAKYGGTGLGLSISKRLVELMGGTIGVESVPGTGSTFWFTVKLEHASEIMKAPDAEALRGMRVLIVDDNATSRAILEDQVNAWGMVSETAANGPEAIARLQAAGEQAPYRVVLMDMLMPPMCGLELVRSLKATSLLAYTRVVLLSQIGECNRAGCKETGINAILRKPVRQSRLLQCLVKLLTEAPGEPEQERAPAVQPLPEDERCEGLQAGAARILVAEDDADSQAMILLMLKRLGYHADAVANGQDAVEALARIRYKLVLMDCQMPEMDGFEATRRIRQEEGEQRHTPIIAVTASAMRGTRELCLATGMDDYLTKPVSAGALEKVLARWYQPPEEQRGAVALSA